MQSFKTTWKTDTLFYLSFFMQYVPLRGFQVWNFDGLDTVLFASLKAPVEKIRFKPNP